MTVLLQLQSMLRQQANLARCGPQRSSADRKVSTSLQCGKCGQRKVTYTEAQTRSADEPMTLFCTCLNCGKSWRQWATNNFSKFNDFSVDEEGGVLFYWDWCFFLTFLFLFLLLVSDIRYLLVLCPFSPSPAAQTSLKFRYLPTMNETLLVKSEVIWCGFTFLPDKWEKSTSRKGMRGPWDSSLRTHCIVWISSSWLSRKEASSSNWCGCYEKTTLQLTITFLVAGL